MADSRGEARVGAMEIWNHVEVHCASYDEDSLLSSRKPFKGARVFRDAKTAIESIVRWGGKIPPRMRYDLGIMDVEVLTPSVGKPTIEFTRDPHQRTTLRGKSRMRPKKKRHRRGFLQPPSKAIVSVRGRFVV